MQMGSKPSKKTSITEAERKLILQMKIDLNTQGIPRDQWAKLIQPEINQQRKLAKKHLTGNSEKDLIKGIKIVQKKAKRLAIKLFTRRFTKGQENFPQDLMDQMLDMMEANDFNPEAMMKQLLPNFTDFSPQNSNLSTDHTIPSTNIDKFQHSRKKMEVVFFDDTDDEDDFEEGES